MIAFVTTIGERTTDLCVEQLERYGYDVVVLDEDEKWIHKYKRFIRIASIGDIDCLRIDADIIVNDEVKLIGKDINKQEYVIAHSHYDMYKNKVSKGGPIFYTKKALEIIRANIENITEIRPEVSAMRLTEMEGHVGRRNLVIGIHGIAQDNETIERAIHNKVLRKQIDDYDFQLIRKINKLYD